MAGKQTVETSVDVYEPTEIVETLMHHNGVEQCHLDDLETGDIVMGETAFERKTPSDFASSMIEEDNRLRDQVERMVEQYENVYVLVEGNLEDFAYLTHTKIEPQSLRGFTASIEARYGVGVKFCTNKRLLVDMAVRIARKHIEEPGRELQLQSSVDKNAPVVKRMMGCINGVGPDTADKIYSEFDNIPGLLGAIGEDELDTVDGVGPKTADEIKQALTT